MEFGAEFPPHIPLTEVITYSKLCEERGLDCIWVMDMLAKGELWVTLTAIALNTSRIKLGSDVTNPYTRHPALTAHALATLQELSGGRVVLGIGSGMQHLLRRMGIERKEPGLAIKESIEIIKGLLSGEEVRYSGKVFSVEGLRLPFSRAHPQPPFYIAAISPRGALVASEVADGILTISTNINHLKSVAQKAKGLKMATWVPFKATEDIQLVKDELGFTISQMVASLPQETVDIMNIGEAEIDIARQAIASGDYSPLPHRMVGDFALFGDPQALIGKVGMLEKASVDQLILSFESEEDIIAFSEGVAPAFRCRGDEN